LPLFGLSLTAFPFASFCTRLTRTCKQHNFTSHLSYMMYVRRRQHTRFALDWLRIDLNAVFFEQFTAVVIGANLRIFIENLSWQSICLCCNCFYLFQSLDW
jgi:hypothetical protein